MRQSLRGNTHMSRSARATGGALASSTPSTSSGRARIAGVGAFRGALLSLVLESRSVLLESCLLYFL